MISYLWLFVKRFSVLLLGLALAYVAARDILPYVSHWIPIASLILVIYVLMAYIVIPAILRFWRMIIPANHLPLYCVTPDGYASDPLNIGIIGTKKDLIKAMTSAGWQVAEPRNFKNLGHAVVATIFKQPYPKAPMSNLYLFGRKHDIGFEQQVSYSSGRGQRHHVRFWATTFNDINHLSSATIHWYDRQKQPRSKNLLWVGAASQDIGITFIKHNMQLTHRVIPDTDSERELIVQQLVKRNLATPVTTVKLGAPYRLINRAWKGWHGYGYLQTDGRMVIIDLS